jgi:hypothetical protein
MKIEIDDDTVYNLFNDILLNQARSLAEEVNMLQNLENIQPYQLEDLESNLYYLETHKAMIEYCFEIERRNEIMNELNSIIETPKEQS